MMGGGRPQMPGGERPEMPEGEVLQMPDTEKKQEAKQFPEGERPEMSEETTYVLPEGNPMMNLDGEWVDLEKMPEFSEGEVPQKPDGEKKEGEFSEMPEGVKGGKGQMKAMQGADISTEFVITTGGNMFMVSQ